MIIAVLSDIHDNIWKLKDIGYSVLGIGQLPGKVKWGIMSLCANAPISNI